MTRHPRGKEWRTILLRAIVAHVAKEVEKLSVQAKEPEEGDKIINNTKAKVANDISKLTIQDKPAAD
jgi:hypothetical protein